ncbi:hypothetical protein SpCBS45565_g00073 [Spizellomyces sp. 'palustris']|nr:hypothetical protein SpCBS45565_g00073 [Spizellomyces sp. 'palustris']
MTVLTGVIGVIIVFITLQDVMLTTLSIRTSGPITKVLTRAVGELRHLVRTTVRSQWFAHHVMRFFGLLSLIMTIVVWFALIWTGFTFLFSWQDDAVISDTDGRPANIGELIYFTGFCLFTVGMGDLRPNPKYKIFEILTTVCSGVGYLLVSVASTYVFMAVQAAAASRVFASKLSWMGGTPNDILICSWNGESFDGLENLLSGQVRRLCHEAQKHKVFPVLFNNHNLEIMSFAPPRIAALDETLTILFWAIPPEKRPDHLTLASIRNGVTLYLEAFNRQHAVRRNVMPPPLPDLDALRRFGIPVRSNEEFAEIMRQNEALTLRRIKLRALVESTSREWADVLQWKMDFIAGLKGGLGSDAMVKAMTDDEAFLETVREEEEEEAESPL